MRKKKWRKKKYGESKAKAWEGEAANLLVLRRPAKSLQNDASSNKKKLEQTRSVK